LPYVKQNQQNPNKIGEYRFVLSKSDIPGNLTKNLKTTLFTELSRDRTATLDIE